MNRSRLAIAFATIGCLAGAAPSRAQQAARPQVTVVTGTLLGADGVPMKLAHVSLYDMGSQLVARAQVERDGRFALATVRRGAFRLELTGVNHYRASTILYAPSAVTIGVHARLKRYAYADDLDSVTAIGDWNHFGFGSGAKALVRQPDGRYTLTVDATADTVAYQLLGLEKTGGAGHSINGTMSDRYVYDEGGDYRSVIPAKDGHATIVLDPARLDRTSGAEWSVTFDDTRGLEGRVAGLWTDWQVERGHFQDSMMAASRRKDRMHYDWQPFLTRRVAMLPAVRVPVLRQLVEEQILDAAAMGGHMDSTLAGRIMRELPPTSPWWAFGEFGSPSRMLTAWNAAHPARTAADSTQRRQRPDSTAVRWTLAYVDRAIAEHPDSNVKASALSQGVMMAQVIRDPRLANDYFDRLSTSFPDAPDLSFLKAMYAPNRLWRVGADLPAFSLRDLDDSTVTYTPASFAGKVVLLDFWATWCGPCIGEMPYLQAAHDSLASRGLQMLSISLDKSADDVRKFRAGEWKMPWLHAISADGLGTGTMRQLEIIFIPRAVLVGRDGKVLAVDGDLRGEGLLPALRRALEAPATP